MGLRPDPQQPRRRTAIPAPLRQIRRRHRLQHPLRTTQRSHHQQAEGITAGCSARPRPRAWQSVPSRRMCQQPALVASVVGRSWRTTRPRPRTAGGSLTLPTWPPGPARSTSRSSPISTRGPSWAGAPPRTSAPSWCSTPCRWRCGGGTGTGARPGRASSTTATPDPTSFAFTAHLLEAGIDASIGTVGDAYDNALMESTIGLYKTELIKPCGPWRSLADVELATAEYVDWYNTRRLHTAIGGIPPAEHEAAYYAKNQPQPVAGSKS